MAYSCRHEDGGYIHETDSHYGTMTVWTCGNCGEDVPIDRYRTEIK